MKNKKLIVLFMLVASIYFASCYNNKSDISNLPEVSFRNEVVPIINSGACGCHFTTGNNTNYGVVLFGLTANKAIYYDAILARAGLLSKWVNGTAVHPGFGAIDFTPEQKYIIKTWIAQGAKDDYVAPAPTGAITYATNILPIYTSTCKGSSCHGGLAVNLTQATMISEKSVLSSMMNSGGSTGHPGGAISLTSATTQTFLAWISQGQP